MDSTRRVAQVAALGRLVLNLRLFAVVLTTFWLASRGNRGWPWVALLVSACASYAGLRWWLRLGPVLIRHPVILVADLAFSVVLLAVTGADSPFLYFTLGTAVLAGLLYEWPGATLFSALLVAGYWLTLGVRDPVIGSVGGFQALVGIPALYPIAAAAALAVRRLLEGQAATNAALAAADERSRLAREMHDSLTKTLQGIRLTASALPSWVTRDPREAVAEAQVLARAAESAAAEARELIVDLRSDRVNLPLHESLACWAEEWSRASDVATVTEFEEVAGVGPEVRYELFCVLKEALRNVESHARARTVRLALRETAGIVWLVVADDGVGLPAVDRRELERHGHVGLLGMAERVERLGGRFEIVGQPGEGVTVTARVPVGTGDRDRGMELLGRVSR